MPGKRLAAPMPKSSSIEDCQAGNPNPATPLHAKVYETTEDHTCAITSKAELLSSRATLCTRWVNIPPGKRRRMNIGSTVGCRCVVLSHGRAIEVSTIWQTRSNSTTG